jgi:hypothetical protein
MLPIQAPCPPPPFPDAAAASTGACHRGRHPGRACHWPTARRWGRPVEERQAAPRQPEPGAARSLPAVGLAPLEPATGLVPVGRLIRGLTRGGRTRGLASPVAGRQWRSGGAPGSTRGQATGGGKSTGPRTPEGMASLAAARTAHRTHRPRGTYHAGKRVKHRDAGTLSVRVRLFCASEQVRADLPPDVAARLSTAPAEPMPPVHYARTLDVEISDKTPCNRGRDARGRFVARARPALRRAGGAGPGACRGRRAGAVAGGDRPGEAGEAGGSGGSAGGAVGKTRTRPYATSSGGVGGGTGRRGCRPGTGPRASGTIREFRTRPYGTPRGGVGGGTGRRGCRPGTWSRASGAIRESRTRPYGTPRGGVGGGTGRRGCRPGTWSRASGAIR